MFRSPVGAAIQERGSSSYEVSTSAEAGKDDDAGSGCEEDDAADEASNAVDDAYDDAEDTTDGKANASDDEADDVQDAQDETAEDSEEGQDD